jgi:hypothetical protein
MHNAAGSMGPAEQEIYKSARSRGDAERLWGVSESLTGAAFSARQ